MAKRDFLTLLDLSVEDLQSLIARAHVLREMHETGQVWQPLRGRTLAMIFQLSSTRTRVAFEAGMAQLGGHAVFLSPNDTQLGRGEPIEDTARVLSQMVDAVMIRNDSQADIETFASYASVPVINGMSERFHPCQLLADIQTFEAHRGSIQGATVAFVGDGYNMCNSYINAARQFGFSLNVACPEGYEPDAELVETCNNVRVINDAREAVANCDLVVTDVWSSMGHEDEQAKRLADFAPFQVDRALLDLAASDTLLMHCLPAHRGEEVSDDLLDDQRSVVWEEAGNRLHTQKALLEFLLAG
ncbi:MAG: ornithine carbamoyltransferase [Pseudomonadota bacterium]